MLQGDLCTDKSSCNFGNFQIIFIQLFPKSTFALGGGGGGGNAIYVPYGDVPPNRAKFVLSLRARVPIPVLFGTLPLVLTYLSFVQDSNPSFDVFNIFKVLI